MDKESLNFGGLDLISKGTGGQRILEHDRSAFYHPQKNGWILIKPSLIYVCEMRKNLIRFWWPWFHSEGHGRSKKFDKCLICCISPEWIHGFNETSTDISSGNGTDWSFFVILSLFKSQEWCLTDVENVLSSFISPGGIDWLWPN